MPIAGSHEDFGRAYRRGSEQAACQTCQDDWTAQQCPDCGHPADESERAKAIRGKALASCGYLGAGKVGQAVRDLLLGVPLDRWTAWRDNGYAEPVDAGELAIGYVDDEQIGYVEFYVAVSVPSVVHATLVPANRPELPRQLITNSGLATAIDAKLL